MFQIFGNLSENEKIFRIFFENFPCIRKFSVKMGKFFDKRDKSPTRCENFSENDKIYGKLLLLCHYYNIINYDTDNYCQFQDLLYSLTTSIFYIIH